MAKMFANLNMHKNRLSEIKQSILCAFRPFILLLRVKIEKRRATYLMKIKSISCQYRCTMFKSIGDFLFQLSKVQHKLRLKEYKVTSKYRSIKWGIFCYIHMLSYTAYHVPVQCKRLTF